MNCNNCHTDLDLFFCEERPPKVLDTKLEQQKVDTNLCQCIVKNSLYCACEIYINDKKENN